MSWGQHAAIDRNLSAEEFVKEEMEETTGGKSRKRRSKRGISLTGFLRSKELLDSNHRRIKLKNNVHSDAALEIRAEGRLTAEDIEAIYISKPPHLRSSAAGGPAASLPVAAVAETVASASDRAARRRRLVRPRSAGARLRTAGGNGGGLVPRRQRVGDQGGEEQGEQKEKMVEKKKEMMKKRNVSRNFIRTEERT